MRMTMHRATGAATARHLRKPVHRRCDRRRFEVALEMIHRQSCMAGVKVAQACQLIVTLDDTSANHREY